MQREGWLTTGLVALLGVGLLACASGKRVGSPSTTPTAYPPAGFAHRQSSTSVELFWTCTQPTAETLVLHGVVVNLVEWEVRSLEFDLVGVDAHEAAVSETTETLRNWALSPLQSAPIHLALRTTGGEVRFDLYYEYQTPSPKIAANGPVRLAQGIHRLVVRDVCSDTLHRAP